MKTLLNITIVLAFCVLGLGAYTRLTNAGLGCPDWPGCYGHLIVASSSTIQAWTEMVHRYAAGSLVILIFIISCKIILSRATKTYLQTYYDNLQITLLGFLIILVIFQALLGMWTVTLKLLPIVVSSHLLGGMLIFITLGTMRMRLIDFHSKPSTYASPHNKPLKCFIFMGILLVLCQIILGAWVSSNYAGISCADFPRCNGHWLPNSHFKQAFSIFTNTAINYQGGVLPIQARATIQMVHRIMAIIVFAYWFTFGVYILKFMQKLSFAITIVLIIMGIQICLGLINVIWFLPLWSAVLHNSFAALFLLSIINLYHRAKYA